MKVLLDTCVWKGALNDLVDAGHDVIWVGSWTADPGDEQVLDFAAQQSRILVTLDKDFGELVVRGGQLHAGIIRLVNISATEQGPLSASALERYAAELQSGAIVTVEQSRVRIRRIDSND